MKIEWASDFHRDGSRRSRPIASTMHGWLAKMRGTLIGNEELRSRGMREMKDAKAFRRHRKVAKSKGKSSGKGFSLFGRKPTPQRTNSGNVTRGHYGGGGGSRPALRQHGSGSHRVVGQTPRRSSGTQSRGSKTPARPGPSRRTTTTSQRRGTTTRRSSGR